MLRALLLGGVALGAALLSTPTAHAGNVCVEPRVSGRVTYSPGRHCPWSHGSVQCITPNAGFPDIVHVWTEVCLPRPFTPTAP